MGNVHEAMLAMEKRGTRCERRKMDLGKKESHSIKLSPEEWQAARICGETEFGGFGPGAVVRMLARGMLKKKGYL